MNSQQLILDRIAAVIRGRNRGDNSDVVLIDDRQYGNCGTLRTLNAVTLEQIAACPYNFQSNYVHFGHSRDYVAALWYDSPHTGTAAWVTRSIPELVAAVVAHLLPTT